MDREDAKRPDLETDDPALDGAAGEILDGRPVDWRPLTPEDGADPRAEVAALRILESLAALHRVTPGESQTWGSLRLLERVGGGAFGEVYRAWDPRLDREVALKLLRAPDVASDRSDSVINEGRLLARVRHPNVMTVYGAERIGAYVGVWTEFIRGRTLADLVRAQGRYSAEDAAAIGLDLCRALAAVHGAALIHRDIKAANVMREDTGRVVLMDFGAGRERVEAAVSTMQDLTGTPLYLAPELWGGAAATPRSDLYSVGVLLYHLVTGEYPVHGETAADVREAHRLGRRISLREARLDLPARFVALVERAIEIDPSARFANADALADALQQLLPAAPIVKRARRWQAAAIATGIVALGLAGSLWWFRPWAREKRDGLECSNCFSEGAISADGRLLVDVDPATGDLTVRDLLTSAAPRRVGLRTGPPNPSNPSFAETPVISRDQKWIAYVWHRDPRAPAELRVVNCQGTPQPEVILPGGALQRVEPEDWSADGTRLLVTTWAPGGRVAGLAWVAVGPHTVEPIEAIDPHTVVVDTRARLSPDDRLIAYTAHAAGAAPLVARSNPENALHIVSVRDAGDHIVDLPAAVNGGAVWTPDSRRILFISNQSRTFDLWSLDVTGGHVAAAPSLVHANIGDHVGLASTADGVYYYARILSNIITVRLGDLDGPEPFVGPMRSTRTFPGSNARWSSDGRSIEYMNGADLMLYTVSNDQSRRLVEALAQDAPIWRQQSRLILSPHQDPSTLAWALRSIDAETGDSTTSRLPPMSIGVSWGTASLDGRTLFAPARDLSPGLPRVKGFDRVVAIDLATSRSTVIWRLPPSEAPKIMSLALSPDGRSIALVLTNLTSNDGWLARLDVDGSHYQALVGPYPTVFPFEKVSWKADTILFGQVIHAQAGHRRWAIMRVAASGGKPSPTGLEFDGDGNQATFDFSPDGKRILFHPQPEAPATRDEVWRLDLRSLGRQGK